MNKNIIDNIDNIINRYYKPEEYPCLLVQQTEFLQNRNLNNLNILDSSPVFRNSLIKYKALILAGAKLTIGISKLVPHNPDILQFLRDNDLPIITEHEHEQKFDIILDNAAVFSNFDSKYGFVELTRSGTNKYKNLNKRVFLADSGIIKRIETCLGTGESYFRGLQHFGFANYAGKRLVVFGSGKVASGIIYYAEKNNMEITVITEKQTIAPNIEALTKEIIDLKETERAITAINKADYIVTATGVKAAVESVIPTEYVLSSNAVLANIGVEDEYGDSFPPERVLNNKYPINFALDEPTRIRFIEATLALHNWGADYLIRNTTDEKIILPSQQQEKNMLAISSSKGLLKKEIDFMLKNI